MNRYIIERPAGMPDWVEIGVKFYGKLGKCDPWEEPDYLMGYYPESTFPYRGKKNEYCYAKPYTPWTPKEGEWVVVWDFNTVDRVILAKFERVEHHLSDNKKRYIANDYPWDYCARITNDDGSLIDIRCTVDELKAKTDVLGPEEG